MAYQHSVTLDADRCVGCTTCLRRCPTEAIRIRNGRAKIDPRICIDCGKCIAVCPHQAKKAMFDRLEDISPSYKYRIALPAPSLYGQFRNLKNIGYVLDGLIASGFDDVFEVAKAAGIISENTIRYMRRKDIPKPVISSACPAIVRLMQLRFPELLDHVLPMLPPAELAARLAKEKALKEHPELKPEEICTVFISPCPAKTSYVKNSEHSEIDYVVPISDVYFLLLEYMDESSEPRRHSEAGVVGLSWASNGGEATALFQDHYLAADGMSNAIRILDQIETGEFPSLEFVELDACPGGCVGGAAMVENPFIAKARLQSLRWSLPVTLGSGHSGGRRTSDIPPKLMLEKPISPQKMPPLSEDRTEAMLMMRQIDRIFRDLPKIDCGCCGSPTCKAFAESVVKGESAPDECVVRLRNNLMGLIDKKEST